jgi:hypothetical protein
VLVGTKDITTQQELSQRKEAENTCRRSSLNKATMKGRLIWSELEVKHQSAKRNKKQQEKQKRLNNKDKQLRG